MHAGVFRPRISEEAFQALLDVMERNFAALTLPTEINSRDNRTDSSLIDSKKNAPSPLRRAIFQSRALAYFYQPIFDENFLRVSHFVTANSREIGGVIEVIFPVSRTLDSITWPSKRSTTMESIQRLNESNEPMEIEEISYTEPIERPKPIIKQEKIEEVEILEVPKNWVRDSCPKVILREPKLTGISKISSSMKTADLGTAEKGFRNTEEQEFSKKSKAYRETKAKLRPLVKKEAERSDEKKKSYFYFWRILFFVLFPVAIMVASVTIARDDFHVGSCTQRFNTTGAMIELANRVFGQSEAIRELGIQLAPDPSATFKVLAIIGGMGVGKSYTAHIISENFQPKKNVFHYVPPLEPLQRHAALALSLCGCNLVVIENLGNRDILAAADFVHWLKNAADNYCVFVIEVINVQETDRNLRHAIDLAKSKSDIENIYKNKKLDVQVVVFKPLDDEVVTKCILEAARSINITLSDSDIDYVRHGLQTADSGCKGAYAKVYLLDKN